MRFILLAVLLAVASPALAEAPLRPEGLRAADVPRWDGYEAALGRALAEALAAGAPTDVTLLVEGMAGAAQPLDPAGDWSCRMLKLGGLTPLTAYAPFRCRITPAGPGTWRIEKLTGSQRLSGTITLDDGGAPYLGVGYVEGGPAMGYAELPAGDQAPVEPGQTVAQVGRFEQAGPDRARLLMPLPLLESEFDILLLSR